MITASGAYALLRQIAAAVFRFERGIAIAIRERLCV
jgi:hypothetical protein